MEPSRREFKIPLARPLLPFGRDRKEVPVRHKDKAINLPASKTFGQNCLYPLDYSVIIYLSRNLYKMGQASARP